MVVAGLGRDAVVTAAVRGSATLVLSASDDPPGGGELVGVHARLPSFDSPRVVTVIAGFFNAPTPWRGWPRWPGAVYPDGDYYLYVTTDLRLGTFGHPWEHTSCVFGAPLVAEVEPALTALLGSPIRRT